ncbi:MAG: MDR/zinc-dependent alcohol dehydrogenase-like family protein [Candidatus Cyclobacteriaceae bacterium M3_2C_046]
MEIFQEKQTIQPALIDQIPEKMTSAIFTKPGEIELAQVDVPEIQDNQVLINLEGCGLCSSNLPPWQGRDWFEYPFEPGAPGHEGWGMVVRKGKLVNQFSIGDRVAMLSYHAFSEYDIATAKDMVKIPDSLKHVPFPGEPFGCALNIADRSDVHIGQTVAVIGIGFLGGILIQLLKARGVRVIAISRRKTALDLAQQAGADHVIRMDDHWDIVNQVKALTGQTLCDRVIEAVGLQWPLDLAGDLVKEGGKLIVAGYHQDGPRQVNMQMWNWKGIDVINAHEREQRKYIMGMKNAIKAIDLNQIDPFPLITHQFPLEDIQYAFELAAQRPEGFVKAIINFK